MFPLSQPRCRVKHENSAGRACSVADYAARGRQNQGFARQAEAWPCRLFVDRVYLELRKSPGAAGILMEHVATLQALLSHMCKLRQPHCASNSPTQGRDHPGHPRTLRAAVQPRALGHDYLEALADLVQKSWVTERVGKRGFVYYFPSDMVPDEPTPEALKDR